MLCLVGVEIGAATMESSMELIQKLKVELLYDPAIPLLGICLKKTKILIQKNICTTMFIVMLFVTVKIWKQPKCPSVDKWIKQLWYIYIIEYCSVIKKKEILALPQHG